MHGPMNVKCEIFNFSIFHIGTIEDSDLLACDSEFLDIRFSTV